MLNNFCLFGEVTLNDNSLRFKSFKHRHLALMIGIKGRDDKTNFRTMDKA